MPLFLQIEPVGKSYTTGQPPSFGRHRDDVCGMNVILMEISFGNAWLGYKKKTPMPRARWPERMVVVGSKGYKKNK